MEKFSREMEKFQQMQAKFHNLQTKIDTKIADLEKQKIAAKNSEKDELARRIGALKSKKSEFLKLKRTKLGAQMDKFLPRIIRNIFIICLAIFIAPIGFFVVKNYREKWFQKLKIVLIIWLIFWLVIFLINLANPNEKSERSRENPANKIEEKSKIETRIITEKETISFETIRENDDSLTKGEEKVAQEGKAGEKTIEYEIKYKDGKEISRDKKSETITREPTNKIVKVGTHIAQTSTPKPTITTTTQNSTAPTTTQPQQTFANCTDLRKTYPHGVGLSGAVDKLGAGAKTPVTNFTVNADLYNSLNGNFDRDDDGIACEA